MKIIYDAKEGMFLVQVEYPETETWISTDDITKARAVFLEYMAQAFDNTVCDKFKDDITKYLPTKVTNKVCESEEDHEWECCGMSTEGSSYRCKKCGKYKFEPYRTSTSNHYKGESK